MASSFSVSAIIGDVAKTANVPAFTSTTNTTTSQVTYWLVQSGRALSAKIKDAFGPDLDYLLTAEMTTVPGFNLVSLPTDTGEVHSVLWARSSSDYRVLRDAGMEDLSDIVQTPSDDWNAGQPVFRIEGQTLAFYPASAVAETIVVFYTTHQDLTSATSFLSRLDADRWLTLDVVCKVLAAKQRDYTVYKQEQLMLEQALFSAKRTRAPNKTETIRNVSARSMVPRYWQRG